MSRSASSGAPAARGGVAAGQAAQEPTTQRAGPQNASHGLLGFRLLALDLASETGWAVITQDQELIASGRWALRNTETPLPTALDALDQRMSELHEAHDIQVIAVEAISPTMAKHTATARILFGLSIQAERWAAEHNVSFLQPVSPARIKKHAANLLNHPRAVKGKEQTLAAATLLTNRTITSSDEADAIVLAHWASKNAQDTLQ